MDSINLRNAYCENLRIRACWLRYCDDIFSANYTEYRVKYPTNAKAYRISPQSIQAIPYERENNLHYVASPKCCHSESTFLYIFFYEFLLKLRKSGRDVCRAIINSTSEYHTIPGWKWSLHLFLHAFPFPKCIKNILEYLLALELQLVQVIEALVQIDEAGKDLWTISHIQQANYNKYQMFGSLSKTRCFVKYFSSRFLRMYSFGKIKNPFKISADLYKSQSLTAFLIPMTINMFW